MSRNAPPPLLPILFGKPQTFAIPTAEPTDARMKPQRLAKLDVFFFISSPVSFCKILAISPYYENSLISYEISELWSE